MAKVTVLLCCIILYLNPAHASIKELEALIVKNQPISQKQLPNPYNLLLTQPLMTETLAKYYKTTPRIKTIEAYHNKKKHRFYRVILMLDTTNPKSAEIIELGFIQINLGQLPPEMVREILTTSKPFGQLVREYKIKIHTINRSYFTLTCSKELEALTHCRAMNKLYGRHNTIIRTADNQWLAKVIEVLPSRETR